MNPHPLLEAQAISLSIVGTAGRGEDRSRLTVDHYYNMVDTAEDLIESLKINTVVSGGAAWADHVAVDLFLEGVFPNLILHLPCAFENGEFLDTGEFDWKTNPGGTANYYHANFERETNMSSLEDIASAIEKGAKIHVHNGFFSRNEEVAKSDYLLACTFGDKDKLKDGGTAHTVSKYIDLHPVNKSYHLNLNDMKLYTPARV